MIPFNKPYLTGKEVHYIYQAVSSGKISGDGMFTKKCHQYFEETMGVKKCLLTTSCTDALEMCAILLNIKEGDEVIMPSFTFVSTSNAVLYLRGAKIVFADKGNSLNPNLDADGLGPLVNERTRAIVVGPLCRHCLRHGSDHAPGGRSPSTGGRRCRPGHRFIL